MKVKVMSLTEEEIEQRDYRDILAIYINDKKVFIVMDGEPEDANLNRDFNDCWFITDLMRQAYQAGINGEALEIEHVKVSSEEI